jgi:Flp pilus assembly protein TadD
VKRVQRTDMGKILAVIRPRYSDEKQQPQQKTTRKDWSDMRKTYKAPAGAATTVYADSKMTAKVGEIFAGSTCQVIGEQDGAAIVLYKVAATGAYKVGFADPKGVQG